MGAEESKVHFVGVVAPDIGKIHGGGSLELDREEEVVL